jgi:hypothetical protein
MPHAAWKKKAKTAEISARQSGNAFARNKYVSVLLNDQQTGTDWPCASFFMQTSTTGEERCAPNGLPSVFPA